MPKKWFIFLTYNDLHLKAKRPNPWRKMMMMMKYFTKMCLNVWSLNSAVRKVYIYPYYLFTTSEVNTIILTTY
jgi:hypothetical protein